MMTTAAPMQVETDAPALQEAEQRVRDGWARYRASNKDRAEAVIETGQQLHRLKAGCAHGTWGPMLDSIGIPHRTARDWMKLAKTATVAVLEKHGIRGTLERVRDPRGVARLEALQAEVREWKARIAALEAEQSDLKGENLRLRRRLREQDREIEAKEAELRPATFN